jgi:hypothetical protein
MSVASATSSKSAATAAGKNLKKPATSDPTKMTQTRATCSAPNATHLYLGLTKTELLDLTTSNTNWAEWTGTDVKNSLYAKGYITDTEAASTHPPIPTNTLLVLVLLRVAASLPTNAAVAADVLRAVAICIGFKHADAMLDGIAADLGEVLGLARASTLAGIDHTEGDRVASSALDAAEVLTRTAQEQAADIATITTWLEDDLRTAGRQVAAAVEASPTRIGGDALGSARASLRTYAAAAAVASHPPARAAALAKAAART